jgi:hypothetical protein
MLNAECDEMVRSSFWIVKRNLSTGRDVNPEVRTLNPRGWADPESRIQNQESE